MTPQTGKTEKKNRKSERSLAALRDALLKLLKHRTFDDLTVRDIVCEAGIGQATFYRHYATKASLLDAVAENEINALVNLALAMLDGGPGKRGSHVLIDYVDNHRTLWSALLGGGAAAIMRQGFMDRLSREFEDDTSGGAGWLPADLGIVFSVTATIEIIAWWLRQPETVPLAKVAEYLDRLAIAPTAPRNTDLGPGRFNIEIDGTIRIVPRD